jgi:hypothetical protein
MNVVLETFAIEAGADKDKIILVIQDRAGWRHEVSPLGHRSEKVNLPSGIKTEFLPLPILSNCSLLSDYGH